MNVRTGLIRGARSTLLWGIVSFVIIQSVLTALLQTWRPQPAYDPEYAYKISHLRARLSETSANAPLVLLFGSSRMATGVRPETLSSPPAGGARIFNLGICRWVTPGQQLIALQRLFQNGIRPDYALFELFPAYLYSDREQIDTLDPARLSWEDLEAIRPYATHPREQRANWAIARSVPAFSERFLLLSRYAPQWVDRNRFADFNWGHIDEWGWTYFSNLNVSYGVTKQLADRYRPFFQHSRVSATSQQILTDIIGICRGHHVTPGFILMPEHSQFRSWYTDASEQRLHTSLQKLGVNSGLLSVDARAWMRDEDFVEGVHLTHAGAVVFTQLVDERVWEPLLTTHGRANAMSY